MNEFRVNVTPEQSRIVQETLFKLGYKWYSGTTHVSHTSEPVLCISPIDKDITYSSYHMSSNMTFDQFKEKYMKFKLPEKWCVSVNDSNVDILEKWRDWGFRSLSSNIINGFLCYDKTWIPSLYSQYTEITFDQFKKHILKQETMEEELKVTKEYVLELARLYPETRDKLKVLFPKAFEDDKYVDIPINNNGNLQAIYTSNKVRIIEVRRFGNLGEKSLFLSNLFNWEIIKDEDGNTVLIPTKKQ